MNDPGVVAALGIEAVQWLSAGADTVTIRITGRWRRRRPAWSGQPLLVVEARGQRHRFPAMPEPPSITGAAPGTWQMSFSVPASIAPEPGGRAWLQLGAIMVPLPRDPERAQEPMPADPAVVSERRLRSSELALQVARSQAAAAEGTAADLSARLAQLERELGRRRTEAEQLSALLDQRERARRAAEQRAHAEAMGRLELARERAASLDALELAQRRVRELEDAVELLRRRADEAEHLAAAARAHRLDQRAGAEPLQPQDLGRREPARGSAGIAVGIGTELALARRRPTASAAPPRLLPARMTWSLQERAMLGARPAPAGRAPNTELSATLEALRAELSVLRAIAEHERSARTEAEARSERLQQELRDYAARCTRAYDTIEELRDQIEAVRLAYVGLTRHEERTDAASGAAGAGAAYEAAGAGAAREPEGTAGPSDPELPPSGRPGPVERERLDAALVRLRSASAQPAEEPPPWRATKPWLLAVFHAMVARDPACAGSLLLALLPAHARAASRAIAYDVALAEARCVRVTVSAEGSTRVELTDDPRPLGEVAFRLEGDPEAVARLIAAGRLRRRLGRRVARVRGDRQAVGVIRSLLATPLSFAELDRAGVRLEPGLAFAVVALMIDPAWTKGERFTLVHRPAGDSEPDAVLSIRDGATPSWGGALAEDSPQTTIICPPEALLPLLGGIERADVAIGGETAPLVLIQRWVKRAQSG